MKLVATSDFRNTHEIEVEDAIHDLHVHKGARISIGGDLPLDKLSADKKALVASLNASGRIVEASNTDAVKRIDAEVAAEKKKATAEKAATEKK